MNVCAHQSYTRFKHRVLDRKESWEESGKTMKEIGFPFLMSQEDGMEGTANTHVGWVLSFYSFWWLWSRSMKYNASSRVITSTRLTRLLWVTPYTLSATLTSSGRKVVVMNWVLAASACLLIISENYSHGYAMIMTKFTSKIYKNPTFGLMKYSFVPLQ